MRILLDTNVWRYLVDKDVVSKLGNIARTSKRHTLFVSPAVLFEAAHTEDARLRSELLSAMVRPWWKRLMPEAYSMAEQFKDEVRRLRPTWLRSPQRLERFKRVRYDWLRKHGGLWEEMLSDATRLQDHEEKTGYRRHARDEAREMRKASESWSPKWRTASLTKTMGTLPSPWPGWTGEAVEAWRIEEQAVFRNAVTTPGHPTFDWIEGEVSVVSMLSDEASWTRFWLHEVGLQRMQKYWLRWAFTFLERQHRVTDGTPGDAQLGTYLTDVDLFLTADKLFVSIAERCRKDAPFFMAESLLVPGGPEAAEKVFAVLSCDNPARPAHI